MNRVGFEFFHHIVAREAFYVHNNIVIYLESKKTVLEELLHPAYLYRHATRFLIVRIYATSHDATKIFSLTSLLGIHHLSHVIVDFGLCHVTLDLNNIYSTALRLDSPCPSIIA